MARLVPIALLSLAASGTVPAAEGPGPRARPRTVALGHYEGSTDQRRRVALSSRGKSVTWWVAYRYSCGSGGIGRGRFSSGDGTPNAVLRPDRTFALADKEPTPFVDGGKGRASFELRGRLGPSGGAGTWRVRVSAPKHGGRPALRCDSGLIRWTARRR